LTCTTETVVCTSTMSPILNITGSVCAKLPWHEMSVNVWR
jgi:hypothetical protein